MSSANLPPLASNGVFSLSASILIDAPRDKVWSTLLDFGSYQEWNPFVRGQVMVDKSKVPLPDQTPKEGDYIFMNPVHLPPTMGEAGFLQAQSAFLILKVLDHENYRVSWTNIDMPHFLLNAERWQILTVDQSGKTKYETNEVFGGLLAYILKYFMREKLLLGFHAMAEGLKTRSERT